MTPYIDRETAQDFNDKLVEAAKRVCPRYGVSIEECVKEAAAATSFGLHAIHNNYFNLPGNGDLGCNLFITVVRTNDIKNGGCEPQRRYLAKFSTPDACVEEYCRRKML